MTSYEEDAVSIYIRSDMFYTHLEDRDPDKTYIFANEKYIYEMGDPWKRVTFPIKNSPHINNAQAIRELVRIKTLIFFC